ncbi:hypothetical protein [Deinococcus yunweiensis]|uniref:hypothetical protein n=1 Tax=Deinococcus yunweiensis TaxID=367282 RepID=UPI00398EBD78
MNLLFEIWQELDGCTSLLRAGPLSNDARRVLAQGAEVVYTFSAGSHVKAMQTYYDPMDRGEYTTEFEQDHAP